MAKKKPAKPAAPPPRQKPKAKKPTKAEKARVKAAPPPPPPPEPRPKQEKVGDTTTGVPKVDVTKKPGKRFNQTVCDTICNFIRIGCWPETAAEGAGISRQTLTSWLAKGTKYAEQLAAYNEAKRTRKKTKISARALDNLRPYRWLRRYYEFSNELRKATAEAEIIDVERLDTQAETIPASLHFKMSRRYPEHWGDRSKLEVTGKKGGPIQSEVKGTVVHGQVNLDELDLPDDVLEVLVDAIEKKRQRDSDEAGQVNRDDQED